MVGRLLVGDLSLTGGDTGLMRTLDRVIDITRSGLRLLDVGFIYNVN